MPAILAQPTWGRHACCATYKGGWREGVAGRLEAGVFCGGRQTEGFGSIAAVKAFLMTARSSVAGFAGLLLVVGGWTGLAAGKVVFGDEPKAAQSQGAPAKAGTGGAAEAPAARAVRGKKLVLKDGNYQVVRDYARVGDRVRYLSAERGEWEELPADMVDWEATAKAEKAAGKESEALVSKVKAQEQANQVTAVMDVDASLQVAKGVFLPSGEGMFALQNGRVIPIEQAGAGVRMDKKQLLKQLASPIPIVPSKHNVEIPGARAKVRISTATPEFYLREAPPDPDATTTIIRSSRPGESGPVIELVRATVKGNKRQLESIRDLMGADLGTERNVIAIQRWDVAANVYRFTLSEALPPGEYALAEILPDGMNLFVWDFGVDGTAAPQPAKK